MALTKKPRTDGLFTKKIDTDDFLKACKAIPSPSMGQMAKQFNVSKTAISNKLKKLGLVLPTQTGEHATTEREAQFSLTVASGVNPVAAAQEVYGLDKADAKHVSKEIMARPQVRKCIDAILTEKGLDRDMRVGKLVEHVNNEKAEVSLKALDMTFKLTDEYPAQKTVNLNVNLDWVPVNLDAYRTKRVVEEENTGGTVVEGEVIADGKG